MKLIVNEEVGAYATSWKKEVLSLKEILFQENSKDTRTFFNNLFEGFNSFLYYEWPKRFSDKELEELKEKGRIIKDVFEKKNTLYYEKLARITKNTVDYITITAPYSPCRL